MKNKTILIVVIVVAVLISIFSFSVVLKSVINRVNDDEFEKTSSEAVEYLKDELNHAGLISEDAKFTVDMISYSYGYLDDGETKVCTRMEATTRVGESSVELFFGVKEYIVVFERDQSGNMIPISYYEK